MCLWILSTVAVSNNTSLQCFIPLVNYVHKTRDWSITQKPRSHEQVTRSVFLSRPMWVKQKLKHNKLMWKWSKGSLIHVNGLAFKPRLDIIWIRKELPVLVLWNFRDQRTFCSGFLEKIGNRRNSNFLRARVFEGGKLSSLHPWATTLKLGEALRGKAFPSVKQEMFFLIQVMKESLVQGGAFKYKEKKTSECCLMVTF